jgi:hypothetical protein
MNQAIYETLQQVARSQGQTSYGEIAPLAHLNMESPADRNRLTEVLGEISE